MATSYKEIIDKFIPTVSEYLFLDLSEDQRYELLTPYLLSAATKFHNACLEDLDSKDDEAGEFTADLSEEVVDILVDFMRVEWLKTKLYQSDLYRNSMSTKDYTVFSPANLHSQIRETYELARQDARNRLYLYSYTHTNAKINRVVL